GLLEAMGNPLDGVRRIRLHGDCHMGNILWRDGIPHFVDFDDARNGPAIQDLWMMLSGDRETQGQQMKKILDGYRDFADFNYAELRLIEPLRTLRIMYHAAWLARRWSDPAFPRAFPFFNAERYWSDHILELREQWAKLDEMPLQVYD
ncbi:MAG TPA: serine/threonine protein kinase, partial [Pseudomonadales bacterium]|nr:serine/threonine protein kinase [Pseudomonadales bacterium]